MPLTIFLDCLFDNDLQGLIIEGNATNDDLFRTWNNIYTEYCGLMQTDNYNQMFELTRDINILNAKIALVENACVILEIHDKQPEIIKILKSIGLPIGNKTTVNTIRSFGKKFIADLVIRQKEYDELVENTPEVSRETFIDDLNALSKAEGYMLPDDITVARFCKLIVNYRKLSEKKQMKESLKAA